MTETACHGIPVLYVLRGDWAEERFLACWWQKHALVMEINRKEFFSGDFHDQLQEIWSLRAGLGAGLGDSKTLNPAPNLVEASGASDICTILLGVLSNKSSVTH